MEQINFPWDQLLLIMSPCMNCLNSSIASQACSVVGEYIVWMCRTSCFIKYQAASTLNLNLLSAWGGGMGVRLWHYNDVIITTIASQITSLTVVYSTVYSDADQRKHQSSASLAFVWGIHRDRWIPRTKGQLRGICFHLMTSSWNA